MPVAEEENKTCVYYQILQGDSSVLERERGGSLHAENGGEVVTSCDDEEVRFQLVRTSSLGDRDHELLSSSTSVNAMQGSESSADLRGSYKSSWHSKSVRERVR